MSSRRRGQSSRTPLFAHLAALVGCAVAVGAGGCGKSGAVVGGACATGYAQCGSTCVDLSSDPDNCGACSHACASGVACMGGVCAGSFGSGDSSVDGAGDDAVGDAGPQGSSDGTVDSGSTDSSMTVDSTRADSPTGDGPAADSSPTDGSPGDSPSRDGGAADSSSDDAGNDGGAGDDGCSPPFNSAEHCGDCVTSCSGATPICTPTEAGPVECAAQCDSPYIPCGTLCIDPARDPNNCGSCGVFCASNLCADSVCSGSTSGNDIVIGHDYFGVLPGTVEARVLSNAVLLASANPLRILSFEEYANPTAVSRVKTIIAAAAAAQSRTVSITVTTSDSYIPSNLTIRNFDLLLVYDQANAAGPTLSALGASWAAQLTAYLSVGGAVVTLDGAAGHGQMPSFLSQSALLNVTSHAPLAWHAPLTVATPGDAVATGVLSPYGALTDTVELTADPASATIAYVVVNPTDNLPVVVHRTVR